MADRLSFMPCVGCRLGPVDAGLCVSCSHNRAAIAALSVRRPDHGNEPTYAEARAIVEEFWAKPIVRSPFYVREVAWETHVALVRVAHQLGITK